MCKEILTCGTLRISKFTCGNMRKFLETTCKICMCISTFIGGKKNSHPFRKLRRSILDTGYEMLLIKKNEILANYLLINYKKKSISLTTEVQIPKERLKKINIINNIYFFNAVSRKNLQSYKSEKNLKK